MPYQWEKVTEVADTPVAVFSPKSSARAEHVLQVLQQWGRQGCVNNLHEAAPAAAACTWVVLLWVLLARA